MKAFVLCLVVTQCIVGVSWAKCEGKNWWDSFNRKGWSTCSSTYINGLYRNDNINNNKDGIYRLESARCCPRSNVFKNQPNVCNVADWMASFDSQGWSMCPPGFFLNGLYRSDHSQKLYNVDYGKCCKPALHPHKYGECYDQDVSESFNSKGWSACRSGFFLTGLYRSRGQNLHNIETFRCCQMAQSIPKPNSLSDVKTRVMDMTQSRLAQLANYLGYGWCGGCAAQFVGEDFRRNRDSLEAVTKGPCKGYMSNQRLKMHYKQFRLSVKEIKYGKEVIQDLPPEIYDMGVVTNPTDGNITRTVARDVKSVRTVTHTATGDWSDPQDLDKAIEYWPHAGLGAGYKFPYSNSTTAVDSLGNSQTTNIKIASTKTLEPNQRAEWRLMVGRQRRTVPYTAIILARFSAELDSFLRWGGGYNGDSTNYHVRYRGSGDRHTFRYTIGDLNVPFYAALKEKSQQNIYPWQWHAMLQRYPHAQSVINSLTDENYYTFTLTGQFEDTHGVRAELKWSNFVARRETGSKAAVDDDGGTKVTHNPPRLFPRPPAVDIHLPKGPDEDFHVEIPKILKANTKPS